MIINDKGRSGRVILNGLLVLVLCVSVGVVVVQCCRRERFLDAVHAFENTTYSPDGQHVPSYNPVPLPGTRENFINVMGHGTQGFAEQVTIPVDDATRNKLELFRDGRLSCSFFVRVYSSHPDYFTRFLEMTYNSQLGNTNRTQRRRPLLAFHPRDSGVFGKHNLNPEGLMIKSDNTACDGYHNGDVAGVLKREFDPTHMVTITKNRGFRQVVEEQFIFVKVSLVSFKTSSGHPALRTIVSYTDPMMENPTDVLSHNNSLRVFNWSESINQGLEGGPKCQALPFDLRAGRLRDVRFGATGLKGTTPLDSTCTSALCIYDFQFESTVGWDQGNGALLLGPDEGEHIRMRIQRFKARLIKASKADPRVGLTPACNSFDWFVVDRTNDTYGTVALNDAHEVVVEVPNNIARLTLPVGATYPTRIMYAPLARAIIITTNKHRVRKLCINQNGQVTTCNLSTSSQPWDVELLKTVERKADHGAYSNHIGQPYTDAWDTWFSTQVNGVTKYLGAKNTGVGQYELVVHNTHEDMMPLSVHRRADTV